MWFRRSLRGTKQGFTIVELVVVMALVGVISTAAFTFFTTSVNQYLALQQDGIVFGDLAMQSQRLAQVLRGLTDISAATANDMTIYAYFYPNDANASLVHYYKNGAGTALYADVTPMTANPPIGTPITAQKKTYTVIGTLYPGSATTFVYLDSYGTTLTLPIADLHTIKEIQVNLAVPVKSPSANGNDAISLLVSLRNRKTNL
jgi:prepilin-type N-terminal cleavage/methylation domain-containing protein